MNSLSHIIGLIQSPSRETLPTSRDADQVFVIRRRKTWRQLIHFVKLHNHIYPQRMEGKGL